MKKTLLAIALGSALSSPFVTPAISSELELSGNFSLVSDYRFRGISQTNKEMALQGGFDLAHSSGFYAGTWASNVDGWANPGGSMEIDLYAGFAGELPAGVGYDVGAIAYHYPGNTPDAGSPKNNSREYYLGFSYSILSYKYSYAPTTWFGVPDSKKSYYHDLGVEFEIVPGLTASAHYGMQTIKGTSAGVLGFDDYSVSLSYDLGNDFAIGLTYSDVSFDNEAAGAAWFSSTTSVTRSPKRLYEDAVVVSISKSF
jgi:uncharacterized protein (TIGR02001 family)